jgi:hypothetical protein
MRKCHNDNPTRPSTFYFLPSPLPRLRDIKDVRSRCSRQSSEGTEPCTSTNPGQSSNTARELSCLTNYQITSEQLLREAVERQEPTFTAPKQRIQDLEELKEFQSRKRTEFEGRIRYSRDSIIGMLLLSLFTLLVTDSLSLDQVRSMGSSAE